MRSHLVPGKYVIHPAMPDWGIGQVQSATENRVTVNFENAGKRLINTAVVDLQEIDATSHKKIRASD